MKHIIFGAANISEYNYIKPYLTGGMFVICADGGIEHARALGLKINLCMGDFDSYDGDLPDAEIKKFGAQKDDTDMMLCVKEAVRRGAGEILIFGGLGGRFDHSLANIHALNYCLVNGVDAKLIDSEHEIFLIRNGEITLNRSEGCLFSVLSLSEKSYGVYIKNAGYKLVNFDMTNHDPIGVSNVFMNEPVTVSVERGTLIIIVDTNLSTAAYNEL